MVRSMYSAISGLRNHQVKMDTIGNNISNVNTVGFKSSRVTFEESMAQLLQGASRPPGNQGGTNPMQVGLGMSIGSVDTMTSQGNLEPTGQITDLAVQGKAYFAVSNGEGMFYSRNGAFQFDSTGKMVLPTNGFVLQGKMGDEKGNISPSQTLGDIVIPFNKQDPAKETTEIKLSRNLDADSEAQGSVLRTNRFLTWACGNDGRAATGEVEYWDTTAGAWAQHSVSMGDNTGDLALDLHDKNGRSLQIQEGDVLTFKVTNDTTGEQFSENITVDTDTTFGANAADSENSIYQNIQDLFDNAGGNVTVRIRNGKIRLEVTGASDYKNFTVESNRPITNTYLKQAFNFPTQINNAKDLAEDGYANGIASERFLVPANETDYISDLYDGNGNALGDLESATATSAGAEPTADNSTSDLQGNSSSLLSDTIRIEGTVGDDSMSGSLRYNDRTVEAASGTTPTTLSDLMTEIGDTLKLPEYYSEELSQQSVDIAENNDPDNYLPGSLLIRGMRETDFAINNLSIFATNGDPSTVTPTDFNTNASITKLREARDTGLYATSIDVFDETGDKHTLTVTFTHDDSSLQNKWFWKASLSGEEQVVSGDSGYVLFSDDGTPAAWVYDDDTTSFSFDPRNGSAIVDVDIDYGAPGSYEGLTSQRAATTAAIVEQDGYPMGRLTEISIDEYGVIDGSFSNGISKALAQIYLADFRNPGGLLKKGDSVYQESSNSGEAVFGMAGVSSASVLKPGALEMSNVELSSEFTSMMTTQRGYQASARVITTSDQLLQELVQLVR